jgi:hypothetical protein
VLKTAFLTKPRKTGLFSLAQGSEPDLQPKDSNFKVPRELRARKIKRIK